MISRGGRSGLGIGMQFYISLIFNTLIKAPSFTNVVTTKPRTWWYGAERCFKNDNFTGILFPWRYIFGIPLRYGFLVNTLEHILA